MDAAVRTGIAIYNAGDYHAAHDAWEEQWLHLEDGTDDERLLHGLIQFTAAIYHATRRNWEGAVGLAESGGAYLAALDSEYRGVDLDPVRSSLAALAADPEVIERRPVPPLRYEGRALDLADLDPAETILAARVYAEEFGYDEAVIERAGEYARADLGTGEDRIVALLFDFVREPDGREVVFQRLRERVERRASRDDDVAGLFE